MSVVKKKSTVACLTRDLKTQNVVSVLTRNVHKEGKIHQRYSSKLSLNRHLYKMDTGVGPVPTFLKSFYSNVTPYEMDNSIRQTVGAGPDSVHFRES